MKFKRVLVANRGEIALRVMQSVRELGMESVAVYSDADENSLHLKMADYAIRLPGVLPADTYLNIPLLIEKIQESKVDAVHPGYGFLAENSQFAKRIEEETSATFIGPTSEMMALMGDKIQARIHMKKHEIPLVPGCEQDLQTLEELQALVNEIGYPIMLKASAGGGGKGMRVIRHQEELEESFHSCKREAMTYFGNSALFCERYIQNPKHIEIQILCDQHGNGVHFFERDCSVQRRHQKLFEEAPSRYLDDEMRMKIGKYALDVAKSVDYIGVGTVEFICESPEKAYFMEMNTRIQVEHPVSECITGYDLIAEQIRVAEGQKIPFQQEDLQIHGHALEARINAEDPTQNFMPQGGRLEKLRWPTGPFVRVDSHLYAGYELPGHYDSLVAKLIVWGRTREEAIARMKRCLSEIEMSDLSTTVGFHEALLRHPDFHNGHYTTTFIEENQEYFKQYFDQSSPEMDFEKIVAISAIMATMEESGQASQKPEHSQWQMQTMIESMNP